MDSHAFALAALESSERFRENFDGLLIEHCHLVHVDRNAITMPGNLQRNRWYPSLHVIIRDNLLEDIGCDGIVPLACDGALVKHNILKGGRTGHDDPRSRLLIKRR
jgi:hypothetical protein